MLLPKVLSFSSCLIVLAASAAVKTPAGSTWPGYGAKSVYSRAIGPPISGMDTITVPYMPKSPMFPKFVDPKMMVSKKTDMLSNLFGGMGPVYPMGFKPFMPYPMSGPSLYSTADGEQSFNSLSKSTVEDGSGLYKRGAFGPFGAKPFGATPFGAKPFGATPFGAKPFGPMFSKFGPMSQFSDSNTVPDYSMQGDFSRRRRSVDDPALTKLRSIMDTGMPGTKDLGPPPAYPTLSPISEESEEEVDVLMQKMGGATAPKQYMPGMFGPFAPMVDPSMFIAKKSTFLDTLFKNLATSTPSPTSTEIPVPKSTIVPPNFWFPTSMIPSPTEYNAKVADFLDKLFDSLKLNQTTTASDSMSPKSDWMRSIESNEDAMQAKVARSVEDLSSINAAKDTIVDSIMSELGDLKGSMVTTMNDLIAFEKATAAMSPKKPFKPFAPGMWPKPTGDAMLPFQQKMAILSQVFDMLTGLQKNITLAVQNAIKAKVTAAGAAQGTFDADYPFTTNDILSASGSMPINMSLLDALKSKLSALDYEMPVPYPSDSYKFGPKAVRTLPKTPASFWVSYPEDAAAAEKRQVDSDTESLLDNESKSTPKQQTRGVKMQMHQGYQSLPAGSVESVQAGGGSTPERQGGGIKLLIQMPVLPNTLAPGYQTNNYKD
ncbi:uncharacterized protein LOC143372073 isoform X2 [Andrena cerasifolii]|uniref:uncharacterized protein LOC143372073 isoform X2 n=1 Tax=Andrena cerasifolii TaxID=2819439 RepID=UPI004037CF11